jgi:hypothetical protein
MQKDTLDIHLTATHCVSGQLHGTNVGTGSLLEYKGECWYFHALWAISGDVTLRKQSNPDEFKILNKEDAQGLKVLS